MPGSGCLEVVVNVKGRCTCRALVRRRQQIRRALVRARNRLRHLLGNYNADRRDLFRAAGLAYLAGVPVSAADRFVRDQLLATWEHHRGQLAAVTKELAALAKKAPKAARAARECLASARGLPRWGCPRAISL